MNVTKHQQWKELEEICHKITVLTDNAHRLRKKIDEESNDRNKR